MLIDLTAFVKINKIQGFLNENRLNFHPAHVYELNYKAV